MTELELMLFMEDNLSDNQAGLLALGFIQEDISDVGFESWLHQPASATAASFYECTSEVGSRLVDDYSTLVKQEQDLDELGIDQTMRLNHADCMRDIKNGMLEVFQSMELYYETQEYARENYTNKE
jgi:hypothetical protein